MACAQLSSELNRIPSITQEHTLVWFALSTLLGSNQGPFLNAWTLNSRYNVLFVSFKSKQAQRPDHVDKTVDSKKRQAIKNRKQKHNLFHVPPGLIAGNRLAMSGIILWNSSGGKVFCRKHFSPQSYCCPDQIKPHVLITWRHNYCMTSDFFPANRHAYWALVHRDFLSNLKFSQKIERCLLQILFPLPSGFNETSSFCKV